MMKADLSYDDLVGYLYNLYHLEGYDYVPDLGKNDFGNEISEEGLEVLRQAHEDASNKYFKE